MYVQHGNDIIYSLQSAQTNMIITTTLFPPHVVNCAIKNEYRSRVSKAHKHTNTY